MRNYIAELAAAGLAAVGTTLGANQATAAPSTSPSPDSTTIPLSEAIPTGVQSVPTSGIRMHYNSGRVGSFRDYHDPANFGSDTFVAVGAGQGLPVKNNAASVCNFDGRNARIFFNSGFAGASDFVPAKTCMNLKYTYNNNASWRWD